MHHQLFLEQKQPNAVAGVTILGSSDWVNLPFKSENKIPHLKESYDLFLSFNIYMYIHFFKYSTNPSLNNNNKTKQETGFILKMSMFFIVSSKAA